MRFIDASLSPVATFYTDQISQDLFDGEINSIPKNLLAAQWGKGFFIDKP